MLKETIVGSPHWGVFYCRKLLLVKDNIKNANKQTDNCNKQYKKSKKQIEEHKSYQQIKQLQQQKNKYKNHTNNCNQQTNKHESVAQVYQMVTTKLTATIFAFWSEPTSQDILVLFVSKV